MAVTDAQTTTPTHPIRPLIGAAVIAVFLAYFELATRASDVVIVAFLILTISAVISTIANIRNATRLRHQAHGNIAVAVWAAAVAVVAVGLGWFGGAVLLNGNAQGIVAILVAIAFLIVSVFTAIAASKATD
jgi:hypothetical protein